MKFSPKQLEALKFIAEGKFFPTLTKEDDGWHARWRAVSSAQESVVDGWVDEYVRASTQSRLTVDAEDQKHETLHDAWMMALRSTTGLVRWDDAACASFAEELREWSGAAEVDVAARKGLRFAFSATREGFSLSVGIPHGRAALKALGQATYVCGALRGLRARDGVLSVALTPAEAETFLHADSSALTDAGYTVLGLPERAAITAAAEEGEIVPGSDTGVRTIRLTVKVAGQPVTAEEIRFLLDQGSSLVFFREHWIEVDRGILKEALRALERGAGNKPNLLAFAMGIGHVGNLEIESLKAHGWIRGFLNEVRATKADGAAGGGLHGDGAIFTGELRPYQKLGVQWIRLLTDHGFGALLADDMGLGKTVETIAWLSGLPSPVLIVAPLTLLSNWRHELNRFAPSRRVYVHQGDERHMASGFVRAVGSSDVVLTSYNLLVRDYSLFSEVAWTALVLDEAQMIKNPDTQVARAVRALTPARRLALTGTPIENSLQDVWALEDFLNPGFLGDRSSFRARFIRPLALNDNAVVAKKLRHALEPFVLRRLKTDPEVAAELGEKREVREYCVLGEAERRAYEAALAGFRASEHRPGDMFALLTELKLICDGGGKLARLGDLLETIFENGESALVFTQYAKVGALLQTELSKRFGRRFPFLHGTLSASAREAEIRAFNRRGETAFILSLKAGGFGLNLTKATHVIHFDRWWNPAVENQATDRAYRIGQEKDVLVHLMITEGTIEERVDEMLVKKSSLKNLIADGAAFWKAVELS